MVFKCRFFSINFLFKFKRLIQLCYRKLYCDSNMLTSNSDLDDSIFTIEYADSVSPLSKAARAGDLQKIKKLISKGSLPQIPDNRGWTSIHFCVAANQIEALKLILKLKSKNKKYLVNLKTWEEFTPLHIAVNASSPSLEMVKVLLKAGADPGQYTQTRLFPLHFACLKQGNIDCIKLLVQFGANVNVQDDLRSFTPLHFAVCKSCDLEVIRFLVGLSDLSLANSYERTAFLEACNSNFLEAVKLFLEKDKSLANFKSSLPPLAYAGFLGNLEMTQLLIESGADVNYKCKALVSCESGDSDLILFDRENFLPIHSSLTNIEVFTLLLKLTNYKKLLELETNYYSFSLYVMVYADENFFQNLLQSDLPNELKTLKSQILVKFILSYPDMEEIVAKKFKMIFKYNFSLTPANVLQSFTCKEYRNDLYKSIKFLYLLARMGISSGEEFQNKNIIINFLESIMNEHKDLEDLHLIRLTHELLSHKVLSLKQSCRIIVRHQIKSLVKSDWLALKMVMESKLPECLKKFILFESFN